MEFASAMGMALILSIFNSSRYSRRTLILLCAFFLASCASHKEDKPLTASEQEQIKSSLEGLRSIETQKGSVKIIPGPSQSSPNFVESKALYGLEELKSTGISLADFDDDGFLDIVSFPQILGIAEFWRFNPKIRKFEKLRDGPIAESIRAHYLVFEDIDRDGVDDIVVGAMNRPTELSPIPLSFYRGERYLDGEKHTRIRYQEVPDFFPGDILPISSISLSDIDLDGRLDLFVANWFSLTGAGTSERDRIYYNKGGKFVNTSQLLEGENDFNRSLNIYPNAAPSIGVSSCDIDQNGFPDFLTTSTSGYNNKMWLNLAGPTQNARTFKDYALESGFAADSDGKFDPRGGGNTFTAGCTDYNNNGFMDIFVGELSHSYDQSLRDRSSFLTNTGNQFPPTFLRTEYDRVFTGQRWSQMDRRVVFADFNIDGLIDILVENTGFPPETRLLLFKQERDHSFTEVSKEWGIDIVNPSGVVVADIDGDGRPDILAPQNSLRTEDFKESFYLFLNRLPVQKNRSLEIHLSAKNANAHGRGALVKVKTKSITQTRWVDSFSGSMPSQNDNALLVGLGAETVQSIEVTWPFLKKNNKRPTVKKYSLHSRKLAQHQVITLCENGVIKLGKSRCN